MPESLSASSPRTDRLPATVSASRRASRIRSAPTAIRAEGLSKVFRIPRHRATTLKERALHPLRRIPFEEMRAVDDVSFDVRAGEFFGIIGRNGSGKSTLLKLISGIYRTDTGTIAVNGRLSPFIELGVGFNPELAARDNVIVNANLMGISRRAALARFDDIIEFAELEEFVDLKLKNYSSGMQVRLAFSTAIQVDAEILVLDEVLAVGDTSFQEKCFDLFRQHKREGKTIVLVTHDLAAVDQFCDRALLMQDGKAIFAGQPDRVVRAYQETLGEQSESGPNFEELDRWGDRSAEVVDAWFETGTGEAAARFGPEESIVLRFDVLFHRAMDEPIFGVVVRNDDDVPVFVTNTERRDLETGSFQQGERAEISVQFDNRLGEGRYFASPAVAHRGGASMADWRDRFVSMRVWEHQAAGAVVDLPHAVEVRRP